MKRCIIIIFVLILCNVPCHADSKWITWKYDNFIIYSHVSKEKSAIVTRQIIAAYDLIKNIFFKTGEKPTIPFTIYILSNIDEVQSIYHGKIKGDVAGFMAKSDEGIRIILP